MKKTKKEKKNENYNEERKTREKTKYNEDKKKQKPKQCQARAGHVAHQARGAISLCEMGGPVGRRGTQPALPAASRWAGPQTRAARENTGKKQLATGLAHAPTCLSIGCLTIEPTISSCLCTAQFVLRTKIADAPFIVH